MNFIFKHKSSLNKLDVEIITAPNQEKLQQRITKALRPLTASITLINPINNREMAVSLDQLALIQSEERMCQTILATNQALLWNARLKEVEKSLEPHLNFIKINKTTIVNILMIESFTMTDNFRIELYLTNGHQEVVNRSFTKLFKERMNHYVKGN